MIESFKEIGEYIIKRDGKNINEPLDILIDDSSNRNTKNVLFIVLESSVNEFVYKGVDLEEYFKNKLKKYLYKSGKGKRGANITPTTKIAESLERTFNKNILGWFKKYTKIGLNKDVDFLVRIGNCLRENKKIVLDELKKNYSKENNIISLKIDKKYIGDYSVFQNILVETAKKEFYFTKSFKGDNKESKSDKSQICCVCNKEQKQVYGFVGTYKFYTVDKPGFVSGGFQQRYAWKNYPVCLNCALKLEAGKKYLRDKLNFNFYGFRYHLIPKFIYKIYYENKKDIFGLIEDWQDPKFTKKAINKLTQDENEILELMSEQSNYLNLNFMFYEAPRGYDGSEFNILLYIEDILPTRLKKLFDKKKEIDIIDVFKECSVPVFENKKKVGEESLVFNFGIVRTFFPRISDNRTYDKYFLDIVTRIFTDKPIDYDFLLRFIMQKIRNDFVNDYPTKISTLKGFMLLNYFSKLKLLKILKKMEEIKMDKNDLDLLKDDTLEKSEEVKQKINTFFEKYSDFFESDMKKAIFLEGALTQLLLNIQYQDRKATPFRVKLKGLKLDEKQIKKLLPEIQNKLEEYGKNYYRTLESIISDYFVSAGNGWELTNDEISFYFVLGMNLSYKFKSKKEEERKNG
jgi:CRISPR-associated protein Csh1